TDRARFRRPAAPGRPLPDTVGRRLRHTHLVFNQHKRPAAYVPLALDRAVELQDDRDVALRVVEEATVADCLRPLVVAGEAEAAVAAKLVEQPPEVADAGLHVAVVGTRRRRPEQDL